MRKHERRLGIALTERQRVAAERGDPETGVDDHGQPALRGEREHGCHARMTEIEPLRPRMQLHAPGAGGQAALQLADRVRVGIDATEGDEPTFRRCRGGEHGLVRFAVAGALHQREHRSAPSDQGERVGELGGRAAPPVGIVAAQVRVGIDESRARQPLHQAAKPGQQELIGVHARTLTRIGIWWDASVLSRMRWRHGGVFLSLSDCSR